MKHLISILLIALALGTSAAHAGKIQNEDVKSLSELTGAGGTAAQLINDTKIYATGSAAQLSALLTNLTKQVIPFSYPGTPATGDGQPWIQVPYGHTLVSAAAVAKTAGSTQSVINIYRASATSVNSGTPSWSSVLSTAITLDATKKTSAASATQPVIGSASGSAGDYYKMEVTTVGTSVADLTVSLVFTTN